MRTAESEDALLEKGKAEEKAYDWVDAAKLYKQVAESYLGKKAKEEAAETYRMLGYAYSRAARTAVTVEEFKDRHENAINAYKKASNLFKQTKNRPKELECEGSAFYITSISSNSLVEVKEAISKSIELSIESSELYTENGDNESVARTLAQAAISSLSLLNLCSEQVEILRVSQNAVEISIKTRKISEEIRNFQYYAEALFAEVSIVRDTLVKKNLEHGKRLFLEYEKHLKYLEESNDFYVLAHVYWVVGISHLSFGVFFTENENDKREISNKSNSFFEKCDKFARKSRDNFLISICLSQLSEPSERGDYLPLLNRFSKIFGDTINYWAMFTNFHLSLSFREIVRKSTWGIFPVGREKEKLYYEKSIGYALKCLEMTLFTPYRVAIYFILNDQYSWMVNHSYEITVGSELAKKTLQIAEVTEQIGKNYDDGYHWGIPPQYYYKYVLSIAYKTQADRTENKDEKIKYLKKALVVAEDANKLALTAEQKDNYHFGRLYFLVGVLTNENSFLRKAKEIFLKLSRKGTKNVGGFLHTHIGHIGWNIMAYFHLAYIEDHIGNYLASAEYYEKAQMLNSENLKTTEDEYACKVIRNYIKLHEHWQLLEKAKAYHKVENHLKAKEYYLTVSEINKELTNFTELPYWAPYWKAWALLEEAEFLSKQERLGEAINVYGKAKISFQNTINNLKQAPKGKLSIKKIYTLEKLAKTRIDYCSARITLEEARVLGKKGKHVKAAEIFASTASQFMELCKVYKIEQEHRELEAIYHLCKAWEQMELAEEYLEPDRFGKAADQFTKASNFFNETKYKVLASGHSAYCLALGHGCEFDKSYDINTKAQLYPKIKFNLRNAASLYEKGGFKETADWALATSTYFDATWQLIKADEELEIIKKKGIMSIASRYLKSASELFGKAGYHNKEKEILGRLERVKKEEEIHISALNSIEKPTESISTAGIGAPACPLETSQTSSEEDLHKLIQGMMRETREIPVEKIVEGEKKDGIKIFISYATADSEHFQIPSITKELRKYPEIERILYWEEDLKDDIYDYMNTNIGTCDIFLLFCSPNALRSESVQMEWQAALKIKKKIIPVFMKEEDVPPLLSTKVGVVFNEKAFDETIKRIYRRTLKKLEI